MIELDSKKIGSRIKHEREKNKISQKQLAKNLGISSSSLQNYEAVKSKRSEQNTAMSVQTLADLSQELKVTTDYLLGLTDDNNEKPVAVDELGLSPEVVREIKTFRCDGQFNSWRKFLEAVILYCSFSEIAEAYRKFCLYQNEYKLLEKLSEKDFEEWSEDKWRQRYSKLGVSFDDKVSLKELERDSPQGYKSLVLDQMKQSEFRILFEIVRALEK